MSVKNPDVQVIDFARPFTRCDCEHVKCELNSTHVAGNCQREAAFVVECYGMKQRLCSICLDVSIQRED